MGLGSLGAGTAPVLDNPVVGRPVLGLFTRMPTASLAVAYTGIAMVVLAWLWLGYRLFKAMEPNFADVI